MLRGERMAAIQKLRRGICIGAGWQIRAVTVWPIELQVGRKAVGRSGVGKWPVVDRRDRVVQCTFCVSNLGRGIIKLVTQKIK